MLLAEYGILMLKIFKKDQKITVRYEDLLTGGGEVRMSPVWISKPAFLHIKEEAISLVAFHYTCIYDRPGNWCSFNLSLCHLSSFYVSCVTATLLDRNLPQQGLRYVIRGNVWLVTNTAKLPIIFYIGPWKSSYLFRAENYGEDSSSSSSSGRASSGIQEPITPSIAILQQSREVVWKASCLSTGLVDVGDCRVIVCVLTENGQ